MTCIAERPRGLCERTQRRNSGSASKEETKRSAEQEVFALTSQSQSKPYERLPLQFGLA